MNGDPSGSAFEDVVAVVLDERPMGQSCLVARHKERATVLDQSAKRIWDEFRRRDQRKVVRDRNQTAVEQPMDGA